MTSDQLPDDAITDADEFEMVLTDAVRIAVQSDVEVCGAWVVSTRGSTNDPEVEIVELARDTDEG